MTEALIDHLWQSTWFALAAALLVLVFRNNSASVRFRIWLAASVKFLIPLPLFVFIGKQLPWPAATPAHAASAVSVLMDQLAEPAGATLAGFAAHSSLASSSATHPHWGVWTLVLTIWAAGFVTVSCLRLYQWLKLNSIAWVAAPLAIEAPLPIRETNSTLEPGIFGILWPVLLLPKGIAARLAPEQLDTIIAHELHHWRRQDNLTAAIHMIVESLFWFHPLVWWLGGRMIVERERAVDEAVIDSGGDREIYAEGILKVCQFYVEPPLPCTSGVSGGTLRKRIEEIMTNRTLLKLHFAKKCLLSAAAAAGVGGPIAIGLFSAPYATALAQEPTAAINGIEMQHYDDIEWKFSVDMPKGWQGVPAAPEDGPYLLTRLARQDRAQGLLVFRLPYDPQQTPTEFAAKNQEGLTKRGFGNFVMSMTTIGSEQVVILDFDKAGASGKPHYNREYYFVVNDTLMYILCFHTNNRDAMFPLYDKLAKTFVSRE